MVFSSTELPEKSVVLHTINMDLFKSPSLKNTTLNYADLPTYLFFLPCVVVASAATSTFQLRTHIFPAIIP